MKLSSILSFALRLIWSKKGRSFLVIFSVLIGTGILFVFLTFSEGIKNALLNPILATSSSDTLVVSTNKSKSVVLNLLNINKGPKLDQKTIDKIKKFPETKSIGKMLVFKFLSTVDIPFLSFSTDSTVFAIDNELLGDEYDFVSKDSVIPVALSPVIIEMFNSSFAESVDAIPRLVSEKILNKKIKINFGKSSFPMFGTKKQIERNAKITAISTRVPAIGIAIPMNEAIKILEELTDLNPENVNYSQLFVKVKNIDDIPVLQEKISRLGLHSKNFEEMAEKILIISFWIKLILIIASGLILFIAFLSLFSLISISVIEQKQTTGILRAIGASKLNIFLIFIFQGLILTSIGTVIGLLIGYLITSIFDTLLISWTPDFLFKPESLFSFSYILFVEIFLIVVTLSLIATFFSALEPINHDPMEKIVE